MIDDHGHRHYTPPIFHDVSFNGLIERELGTAVPYGCNDRIDSVGNLTSPACSSVNVMNLFNYLTILHAGSVAMVIGITHLRYFMTFLSMD